MEGTSYILRNGCLINAILCGCPCALYQRYNLDTKQTSLDIHIISMGFGRYTTICCPDVNNCGFWEFQIPNQGDTT